MLCLRCTEKRLKESKEAVDDNTVSTDIKEDRIAEIEKRFSGLDKEGSVKCRVCQVCGCRMYSL